MSKRASRLLKLEVLIVLGLSLGESALFSIVRLISNLTAPGGLAASTATLNQAQDVRPYFDLTRQLLGLGFAIVPVVLVLYLLSLDRDEKPVRQRLGLTGGRLGFDTVSGVALTALIGIPGVGVYLLGRHLGITAEIITSPDLVYWWTGPLLILAALKNAVLEEVIVVGYLMTRLKQLGWSTAATIVTAATLRGSYHLYQGIGQFVGNFLMGLIFGYWFHKTKRVMPLVIAHTLLDVFAFVGYLLLADTLGLK